MVPLQHLRDQPDFYREGALRKHMEAPVDEILELDARARGLRRDMEAQRAEQNAMTRAAAGRPNEVERERLSALKQRIQALASEVSRLETARDALLLQVPNPPLATVPYGTGPEASVTVREWGQAARFAFAPRAHWDIGETLGMFDSERAAKLSGARFMVLRGEGARLQRALVAFFLDAALRSGHVEIAPPHLVRREAMVGTGQLPKFEDDAFRTDDDLFLIPTAEVPLTNLYREEVLDAGVLPIRHVAWTQCFRREAGSAGKDSRGFIRLHQFEKVELVHIVEPEHSPAELERLVADAEALLQALGLRHRVLLLCDGDMGFSQAKTYDLEAWSPALERWLEVSSCTDFGDFQARRAEIRYRPAPQVRPRYPHTLNGSALALPRVIAALLETYQRADGTVTVPEVLQPYMAGTDRLVAM